jgi:ABC-type uncharacterized transport system substrate-binding protein
VGRWPLTARTNYTLGRYAAKFVRLVLLGAAPGDLPIEQVNRFHFAINLKTANRARADDPAVDSRASRRNHPVNGILAAT